VNGGERVEPDTGRIGVRPEDGEEYEIRIGDHLVRVDQPPGSGGRGRGPTPTELFVGALAGCVAFYAGRYLTRHGYGRDGMAVRADFDMATDRPARVAAVRITVEPPAGFPEERVAALVAVASHCTVHNTIVDDPTITVAVSCAA
jgi:putative redox protein